MTQLRSISDITKMHGPSQGVGGYSSNMGYG